MSSICLNMIVKNEAHIITETLQNLCEHIDFDYWVIADTGSTDNTAELINNFFEKRNIKGELVHHTWKNFSYNRNLALRACLGKSDYVFFFDADDLIEGKLDIPRELTKDAYNFKLESDNRNVSYFRKLLVKNSEVFYWRGVVHEYIENRSDISQDYIRGDYAVISRRLGARNKVSVKEKYLRDAELLTTAFIEKEDPGLAPRYAFYAAQSYQDAGEINDAIEWYLRRTSIVEGWIDERYLSYLRLGFIFESKNEFKQAIEYWQEAIKLCPERAEAWYHVARRYNWDKQFTLAYAFASQGETKPYPETSRLFLQKDIYQYWIYYEVCINAYHCQNYAHSYEAFKKLIEHAPADLIQRIENKMQKYIDLINNDSFGEIKHIKSILIAKKLDNLVEKYFSL